MKTAGVLLLIAMAFTGGFGYGRWFGKPAARDPKTPVFWVDPMHPWYKSGKPGIAPDCNMKLVPVYPGEESQYQAKPDLPQGAVEISAEKQQLIGVTFGTASYENSSSTLRAAARVMLDETKIAKVQTKLEGWIDQVFVDFTGKLVKQGDPLLTVYSPEALATQQEFLLAMKAQKMAHADTMQQMMGDSTANLVAAAKRRLELWDIGEEQIEEIARSGQTLKNLTLHSPIAGFVMERNAFPKQHVTAETALYTIADLGTVWVVADVFEYEASTVRMNQPATLTLSYLPGRTFRGRVSYILPQVDASTRTLKVRMQFDNPGYALKPDMYGEVEFQTGGGRKLVVPQTAVLNSGDRQVVFLDRGNGVFEPRDVRIGAQSGGRTEILSGLQEGERIVTSGNFLIDSESRLK